MATNQIIAKKETGIALLILYCNILN